MSHVSDMIYKESPVKAESNDTAVRWDEVNPAHYKIVKEELKRVWADKNMDADTLNTATNILTNSLFLLYERLYLKMARDVNYKKLQKFAIQYRDMFRLMFTKIYADESPKALESWICPQTSMAETTMYSSSYSYR